MKTAITMILIVIIVSFLSAFTFVASEDCSDCGLCYNHGGNYKCLTEYSPTCDKWHASFDCPVGIPCETTNDPEKARPCSLEGTCPRCNNQISTDICCTPTKDGSTFSPTPTPPKSNTWSNGQATELPEHEWVVLDHNDGPEDSSFGIAVTVSDDYVFVGGKTTSTVLLRNPGLAASRIAMATPQSDEGNMFLSKVTLAGEPISVHLFPGSQSEQPNGLAVSKDGLFLSMVGYFRGTLTLGSKTYSNDMTQLSDGSDCGSNCPKDAFLAKLSSDNADVLWSIHFSHEGDKSTELFATAITDAGDIVYAGHIANTGRLGVVAKDGVVKKWETVYDTTVGPFNDVKAMENGDVVAVGSLQGSANFGGDVGTISSTYAGSREGLVLVLDPESGYAKWAALMGSPYQYDRSSKAALTSTTNTDIYVACAGPCNNIQVSNNDKAGGIMMANVYKGGVAKFSSDGEPKWISEIPTQPQGLAAMEGSAVYVSFYEDSPVDYGDDTFLNWIGEDTKDQFIIKFNPDTGKGEWVMQQGGTGKEYVRRMDMDKNGDIYTTGKSGSNPGYFDNIQMTEHDNSNQNDMFLAKMAVSSESLPFCKCDKDSVKPGYCFLQNTCYEDGVLVPPGDVKCVGETVECSSAYSPISSVMLISSIISFLLVEYLI